MRNGGYWQAVKIAGLASLAAAVQCNGRAIGRQLGSPKSAHFLLSRIV